MSKIQGVKGAGVSGLRVEGFDRDEGRIEGHDYLARRLDHPLWSLLQGRACVIPHTLSLSITHTHSRSLSRNLAASGLTR